MVRVGELFVSLGLDSRGFKRGLRQSQNSVKNLGKNFAKAAKAVTVGFGAALAAVGVAAVREAAKVEQLNVAFKALTGSAQAAQRILQDLRDFAATTPFQFDDLAAGARNLIAFGFETDKVVDVMKVLGDAVAAIGGGSVEINRAIRALGQMRAKGKVAAEEINQLAELGLPIRQILADGLMITTAEIENIARSGVTAEKAIGVILKGLGDRFEGLAVKQSGTVTGLFSTLRDETKQTLAELGKILIDELDIPGLLKTSIGLVKDLKAELEKVRIVADAVGEVFIDTKFRSVELVLIEAQVAAENAVRLAKQAEEAARATKLGFDPATLKRLAERPAVTQLADVPGGGLAPAVEGGLFEGLESVLPDLPTLEGINTAFDDLQNNIFLAGEQAGFALGEFQPLAEELALQQEQINQVSNAWEAFGQQTVSVADQLANQTFLIFQNLTSGISNAIARAIVFEENLAETLLNVLKQAGVQVIATLIQLGINQIAAAIAAKVTAVTRASADIGASAGIAAAAATASFIKAFGFLSIPFSPAAGAAAAAAVTGSAAAAITAGKATGALVGLQAGGIVSGPLIAALGEGGESEVVAPLSDLQKFIDGAGTIAQLFIDGELLAESVARRFPDVLETNGVRAF